MPRRNNTRRRRPGRRGRRSNRPRDPIIGPQRTVARAHAIPSHTTNPKVTRTIRIEVFLTTTAPIFDLLYFTIATGDQVNYSASTLRYQFMRVLGYRFYLDVGPATPLAPAMGLVVTDTTSGVSFTARPVTGSTCASLGYRPSFEDRTAIEATTSTTVLAQISTDQTIVSGGNILLVIDATVEFQ